MHAARRAIHPRQITSIDDLRRLSDDELLQLAQKVSFYHTIEVRPGVVIQGHHDYRPCVSAYGFPDVTGMRVLDVGRASGFFSFLFEHAGAAHVTAVDLPPNRSKHLQGMSSTADDQSSVGRLDFWVAHALSRSCVEPVWCDALEISEATVGSGYDLAFLGSLLVHLSDPIRCLARVRDVLKPGGLCVVANPIGRFDHLLDRIVTRPYARLAPAEKRSSWWIPNIPGLAEMLRRAGYDQVRVVTRNLLLRRSGHRPAVHHAVVHGIRPMAG